MLTLPPPDRTPLVNAALPLVVAQVRFEGGDSEPSRDKLGLLQSALAADGLSCRHVNKVSSADFVVTPGQPPAPVAKNGWQLVSDDELLQVTVMPDSAAIETQAFRSYDEQFGHHWETVLGQIDQGVRPVTTTRLGIRFVNVLRVPGGGDPGDWTRWIRSSLCALLTDETLAPGVLGLSHQVVLDVATDVRATVRSGTVEAEGQAAFLLDIDTFSEPNGLWSLDDVVEAFARLNEHSVAVFQAMITPDMLAYLRTGEGVES